MSIMCPCLGCKDRKTEPVNCHQVCEKYKSWSAGNEEIKEKKRSIKALENMLIGHNVESSLRNKKKRRSKDR